MGLKEHNACPNLIIFGAGKNGICLYKWLLAVNLGKQVYAFCDSNYSHVHIPWTNMKILSYDMVKNDKYIYLVTPNQKEDIVAQLKADGQEFYCDFELFVYKYYHEDKHVMDLISQEVFELNDGNELLQEYYRMQNYKVINYNVESDICYVFFSGNGLYYPNNKGTFLKTIKAEDRYEWENIVELSEIPSRAAKCIYLRDVRKTWYATGINSSINSIDKLVDLLKEITKGYKVITVGNSAGGYMASLIGAKLNAAHVLNFSGQYSLYINQDTIPNYFYLNKNKTDERICQYYNIVEEIRNTVPILYFYPKYCEGDSKQAVLVKDLLNVYCFAVDSTEHGRTLDYKEIAGILTQNMKDVVEIYQSKRTE